MARRVVCWLVSVSAVLLAVAPAGPAGGETALSSGCAALNEPFYDNVVAIRAVIHNAFNAGERVTVTAGNPSAGQVVGIQLEVPVDVIVDTDGFPGTLSYTFPASTTVVMGWRAVFSDPQHPNAVTWSVTCTAPAIATTLEADPTLLRLLPPRVSVGRVSARLTTAEGAAPVVGQPVTFRSGGTALCTGVTDAGGRATCSMTLAGSLAVIANGGFTASFAGGDGFLASSDSAPLIE